jgi:hypothetical protein
MSLIRDYEAETLIGREIDLHGKATIDAVYDNGHGWCHEVHVRWAEGEPSHGLVRLSTIAERLGLGDDR